MRRLLVVVYLLLAVSGLSGSVLFDQLQKEYKAKGGVELVAGNETFPVVLTRGPIAGKNVPKSDIDIYLYLFRKEFGKYPAELFTQSGLKRVVFCRELSVNGQPRAAVSDSENGALYLDVRSGIYSETYRRKVIHRDFYQLIDAASHDTPGDADWVALNPPGAVYGVGGGAEGDNKGSLLTHPAPGFVDPYAMAGVVEDKAEIFSNLMVNDIKLRLLLKQDEVLRAKAKLLQEELQQFCAQTDDAFWARVAKQF